MSQLTNFKQRLDDEFNEAMHDPDKVVFALEMVLKRADDTNRVSQIHSALMEGDEAFGKLLRELIEIDVLDDVASTVSLKMAKGE